MKEATGELNVTLIVVTIVALLSTLFFSIIWPRINRGFRRDTSCNKAICNCEKDSSGNCTNVKDGLILCKYYDENGEHDIMCAWKG